MIYDEIFINLSEIIESNKGCKEVYSTFKFTENIIRNKEVSFKIDPNMTKMLNGSGFGKGKDPNSIYIFFGSKYLETYSKTSSIHYTILMHELKHLFDYFNNKDFFFKSTEKERNYYEFNAREIEAKFIKYYLNGNLKLTKLEKLMLESYENDELNEFITLFQRVDKNIYYIFKELEDDYRNRKISEDYIITTILNGAKQIIEDFNKSSNKYSKFSNYVSLKSFRNCMEDIVLEYDNKKIIFNDILKIENHYLTEIYCYLYDLIDDYSCNNKGYISALDNHLEEEYIINVEYQ